MCGRRGGNNAAAMAEAQAAADREAARVREEQARAAQAEAERVRLETEQRNAARRSEAIGAGRTRAMKALADRGVDPNRYAADIDERLAYNAALLPSNTEDFTAQFGDPFVDSVINTLQTRERGANTRALRDAFGTDFADRTFSTTADDPFVEAILGRQRTEAMNTLDRARARGQLDESGFTGATTRLGELEKAGRSTAQSLADAVIGNRRSDVNSMIQDAFGRAGSTELGQSFDPSSYINRVNQRVGEFQGNLEGDVTSALQGQQFFDIGDLITRGGEAQGVANPTPAFLDAQAARTQLRQTQRGAGQGGTF
ncbi:hypothetical protein UFOVP810_54 [uncultured Caudovirales phage]|uniref:Uncharacterized protein n=1 Tax=uncultured Caudovirales phage TaxID=2100421 RepID=A0A6J5NW71_9CAUD|nr:hypothetical protein UFOVP810_54 [uncultured Caudovirales phage]